MGYKVIQSFTDLQDFNHLYQVGDIFPRLGLKVSQSRLDELSSSKNKQGKPLITKIEEKVDMSKYMNVPVENTETEYTKTDINRMPLVDLKKLAKKNGIDEELSGSAIKKQLIDKLKL